MGINAGDEMWFFTLMDDAGMEYVAMTNQSAADPKYLLAAQVMRELGLDIPDVLQEKL